VTQAGAGPQLHANGKVPENCNHFSQPLVSFAQQQPPSPPDKFS